MLSILYGIGSAIAWGAADFTGGLASKRARAYQVLIVSEFAGLFPILGLLLIWNEPLPPLPAWLWSLSAGAVGSLGLLLLYRALAEGQMAIAAPVSAVLAAVVPIVVGTLTEGLPDWLTLLGIGLALVSIWIVSQTHAAHEGELNLANIRLPFIAGIFFGLFFVLMHNATREAVLWPVVSGRVGGTLIMLAYALVVRGGILPARAVWPVAIFSGVIDVAGSLCYVMAARGGRMDIAAVLAALYPATTVILAWLFLKEKIAGRQTIGILLALGAITLMTI